MACDTGDGLRTRRFFGPNRALVGKRWGASRADLDSLSLQMGLSEKRRVFEARAAALRRRAMNLIDEFKSPAVRDYLELVVLRIEEDVARLEDHPEALAALKNREFLAELTLCVMRLTDLRRSAGPYAPLPLDLQEPPNARQRGGAGRSKRAG